jgi:hypothetical protein
MLTWGTKLLYKATYTAQEEHEKRDHADVIATVELGAGQPDPTL